MVYTFILFNDTLLIPILCLIIGPYLLMSAMSIDHFSFALRSYPKAKAVRVRFNSQSTEDPSTGSKGAIESYIIWVKTIPHLGKFNFLGILSLGVVNYYLTKDFNSTNLLWHPYFIPTLVGGIISFISFFAVFKTIFNPFVKNPLYLFLSLDTKGSVTIFTGILTGTVFLIIFYLIPEVWSILFNSSLKTLQCETGDKDLWDLGANSAGGSGGTGNGQGGSGGNGQGGSRGTGNGQGASDSNAPPLLLLEPQQQLM